MKSNIIDFDLSSVHHLSGVHHETPKFIKGGIHMKQRWTIIYPIIVVILAWIGEYIILRR
jgi:hypothetical protein